MPDVGEERSRQPGRWSNDHRLRIQRSGQAKSVPHAGGRTPSNLLIGQEEDCTAETCVAPCVALDVDAGGRTKYRAGRERASRFFSRVWYSGRAEPGGHPTAKPDGVADWLSGLTVREGMTVLDPFAGGGSLAVAAARAGASRVIAVEREAGTAS